MNKAIYVEKGNFVTNLNKILSVIGDFEAIKYSRSAITGGEYVKISDVLGGYVYLDVTGASLESILKDVCKVVLNGELESHQFPKSIIHDKQKLREIAPLFK